MMSDVVILLMGMCAIILGMVSLGNILIGRKIEEHACGGVASNTLSNPRNTTIIVTVMTWIGFMLSLGLFTIDNTVVFIVAIAMVFSVMLLACTTFVFSMAVLSTMNNKVKKTGVAA
jgi:hypothetical protein